MQQNKSTADRLFGFDRIYGKDKVSDGPYMTRLWVGRLRLHIFHRGDQDPDCHDHPWDFWTFPLVSYLEEVFEFDPDLQIHVAHAKIVPAFHLTFRPATHTHRVLGRWSGKFSEGGLMPHANQNRALRPGKIVTLVWRGKAYREWGFTKHRGGKWCWVPFYEYIHGSGKDSPCP
jgi:hypothetical protein